MIGTITYILARAGWRAMNGTIADERRRLAGAEPPAAYVSYDPRLLAGVGWFGYRIAFKGGDRQMIERARYMLSERYTIRDSYEYYADGVYVIGVLLRQRVPHYGIGGAQPAPVLEDYLNFYMPNGGTVTLTRNGSPTVVELEYSIDNQQTWKDWQEVGNVRTLTLTAGQKMWLRNKSATQTGFSTSGNDYYQFSFVGSVEASGNCNSLLCKYPSVVTTISGYCYLNMFQGCISLTLSNGFTLPATTLAYACYQSMFSGCTSLTLPDGFTLPANTIAPSCYAFMFYNCTSLILPDGFTLPATNIHPSCYNAMFRDCTSLTLPDGFTLPATTLANYCYYEMFRGCTSLTLPDGFSLPATTLAYACYYSMFYNCTTLTLPAGFTLPAETLTDYCYYALFYGCTSLNVLRTLMTDISASDCLTKWLNIVSAQGDFYCPASLTIPTGESGIPSGWIRHDI